MGRRGKVAARRGRLSGLDDARVAADRGFQGFEFIDGVSQRGRTVGTSIVIIIGGTRIIIIVVAAATIAIAALRVGRSIGIFAALWFTFA